jgi:predicted GNAT superfamily acetyltransferase
MTEDKVWIDRATEDDLDGIMALQKENQLERGGMLSASFPRHLIAEMMRHIPLIVARRGGHVIGFLLSSTQEMYTGVPIIETMLAAYSDAADFYVYGPICVKAEERGKGLAQAMFTELRRLEPQRDYILFIRNDNQASLRAHRKMEMREVASFVFSRNEYIIFSSPGSAADSSR